MAHETLALAERDLGQEHQGTLTALSNLGGLYYQKGRYDEAEPLYQRTLETRERVLGKDHPDTLISVNNLADLYQAQGRYGEAEPLLVRALETRERILGKDHPEILTSLNNLAGLYRAQGRYGEAEPLYLRAIEAGEQVWGKNHPHTLTTWLNLAVTLINGGQRDRALRELRRVDEGLRGFVGDQLDTTLSERIRRQWLLSESKLQNLVFRGCLKTQALLKVPGRVQIGGSAIFLLFQNFRQERRTHNDSRIIR